jgi:hypothetical protein
MSASEAELQGRVDQLFDRFERMTDAEFMLLRSVWEEQDPSPREQAWSTVKATLRARRTQGLLDQARNRVAAWLNNYPAQLAMGDVPVMITGSGMDPGSIRKAALPPMLDAIAATIASDGLSASEQTVLLEPLAALAPHKTLG